jgi:DNA replication protein DnaC
VEKLEQNLKDGRGLIISGPRGTGKTRLSAWVLTRFIKRLKVRSAYTTSAELYHSFRNMQTVDDTIQKFQNVDVLLLDDLGESIIEEWNKKYLYLIINWRYERKMVTLANTMRSLSALNDERYVGGHIISRLVELAGPGRIAEIEEKADHRYQWGEEK